MRPPAGRPPGLRLAAHALLVCTAFVACAGPAPEAPASPDGATKAPEPRPPAAERPSPATLLARLADEALERGDLDQAEQRFRRIVEADPGSFRGRAGLGRVALARGDRAVAREHFDAVLAADPENADALFGRAEVERLDGNREAALAHLRRALARGSARPEVHARLAELTGPAPRGASLSSAETLRLAEAHPYDPWALVGAAEVLERTGQREAARGVLEKALWIGDRDPASALVAVRRLARLDGAWAGIRLVPVHVYADESIRAHVGWRFRLRSLLAGVSGALSDILDTWFVPVSIGAFRSEGASDDLDAIDAAFRRVAETNRQPGIRAAFTDRRPPQRARERKMGLATFLGRDLTVRLEPGSVDIRVFAHELLHLYGAMHVVDEVDSLMNPMGESLQLDRASYRIVRAMRGRSFQGGGPPRDVLPRIDLAQAIAAYKAALTLNLTYRRLGLEEALASRRVSRYRAANEAREAVLLDTHLADVLAVVSMLLQADARHVEALMLLEAAVKLYRPDTRRQRETAEDAERLRRWLVRTYGVD